MNIEISNSECTLKDIDDIRRYMNTKFNTEFIVVIEGFKVVLNDEA